ncbi:MAG: hypothetical protein GF364_00660 [Candidatus Lokiarchaeota archaeon]|nr:hypothetical protein [Candidatus Lokiarchaeota archaeon]
MNVVIEPIETAPVNDRQDELILPELDEEDNSILNPAVPPTSGIRMLIFQEKENALYMPVRNQYRFFRIFKAISLIAKSEVKKEHPSVLIVTDERPAAAHLLKYCAKIFAFDGYKIFFEENLEEENDVGTANKENKEFSSNMSTPYGSFAVNLFEYIDVSIVITASHNPRTWDGIKFYINEPIPISGGIMQEVFEQSRKIEKIGLIKSPKINQIKANEKNNEYVVSLVSEIMDLSPLADKNIVIWPYVGTAPEIQSLFKKIGADTTIINETMEPPDPVENINKARTVEVLREHNANIGILLDTDRDRVVMIIKQRNGNFITLFPNELYTAMHNILVNEYNKKIINVRTVPSDPRGDKHAIINIVTGVGYKHLGLVLYAALNKKIRKDKFDSSLIYLWEEEKVTKIKDPQQINHIILEECGEDEELLMVLWEESGGHTVNILNKKNNNLQSKYPLIGDKYPAVAILILCALIEKGYNLLDYIDRKIMGTFSTLKADNDKKLEIMNGFSKMKGKDIQIQDYEYHINYYTKLNDTLDIIWLKSETTNIYFRASGTGPLVRIYAFGPRTTVKKELENVKEKIRKLYF